MKPISIREAADAAGGRILRQGQKLEISGVSTDSRTIKPGDLFAALEGEKYDGHDFLADAAQKGAAALLISNTDKPLPENVGIIVVDDTLTALQDLAAWYLKKFSADVVAITGSTGKTTTKDMIASVLSRKFNVLKTQGNYNNEIGLPLTLFNLEPGHEVAVLEMGMSGFGEIRRLAAIAPPKIAIITNIGISHIEKLGSRENIWKAKSEILENFNNDCIAIMNDDNDLLHNAVKLMKKDKVPYRIILFGTSPDAEYRAGDIQQLGEEGIAYNLYAEGQIFPIRLNAPGIHNVYNSLAAIAAGRAFGIDMQDIQAGLLDFESGSMRLNIFSIQQNIKVIDDAYNASPDSVNAALNVLKGMDGTRKIAILGDMLELGEYSASAHRQVGKTVAESGVNILVTKGRDSCWIGEGAIQAGMNEQSIIHFENNQGVIQWLSTNLQQGDRILIKGSRGMHMEEVVSYLKDGDDQI